MRRVVSAFFFLSIAFQAAGQSGNEWIQFSQPYVRIPVGSDGLYRVAREDLQQAGFPVSGDPRTLQLFHRGIEQAIIVQGESDGVFHETDYVEFYGRANDGALDSTLYEQPAHQPHRYYNLYSDTTSYFLTHGSANGKRMSVYSSSVSGLLPETHHVAEKLLVLKDSYSPGLDYGSVHKSIFDIGEGWMGVQILQTQEVSYVIEGITETVPAAGKPVVEVLLTGRGPMFHSVDLSAGSRLLSTITFSGYESHKHTQEIEWSDIDSNGKLTIKVRVTGSAGPDRVSAGYIRLTFPQLTTMAGVSERILSVPERADNVYLQIQAPSPGTRLFDITDPNRAGEILGTLAGALHASVPATTARKILATSRINVSQRIRRVTFRDLAPGSYNYVIVTHPVLRTPASGYVDPVKAYAEYRSLPEGGGFDTLVVNIDQLYDQFNFGEQSPRAIYQFLRYAASVKAPEFLFLIGKGLDVNYGYHRNPSAFPLYKDLVPSGGYPASDMAYSAGLSAPAGVPGVATGRLTAITPQEVAAYLNKVRETDALPFDDLNRKKILHLSGGIEDYEPALFRGILEDFADVAESHYLGGRVESVAKQTTGIKLLNIAEQVNDGLGLITFFGHSSPNVTDVNIGFVTDPVLGYNNKGKYPFMLMNGCDAGSFFLNTTIFGENWIKTADRGAVGFIAHSAYGLLTGLQRYSSTFYQVAFGDSVFIRRPVGHVQREVARRYVENFGSSAADLSQVQQMVLLGDPALHLFGAGKPDYAIDKERVSISSFSGEAITAYADSFRLNIPVRNFGIAGRKNIRIEVSRQFNEQPPVLYDTIIQDVLYADTISMVIRKGDDTGFGINVFSIMVDADGIVEELSEANNAAVFEYFIPLNSTRNLYPYNYGIVSSRELEVSFQYTDLQAAPREYLIEVDTVDTFDSGYRKQFQVTTRVLGKQHLSLLSQDTLVYYWRTKIAQPLDHESKDWTSSSFTFIDGGREGWAQVHFPQLASNALHGLVHDPALRILHYEETTSDIAIRTFSTASGNPLDSVSFKINGAEYNLLNLGGACRNNTINLVAFDRKSTQPYAGLYFTWYELLYQYGGRRLLCGREPYVINSFKPNELVTGDGDDLAQYIENVQEGDSVVLFSIGNAGYEQWPEEAKTLFSSLGISALQLGDLRNGDAAIVFGRKGAAPGSAMIFHAPSPQTTLQINKTIAGRFSEGTMTSVLIGPAAKWEELVVKYSEVEDADDFRFSIVGIRTNGIPDTLRTDLSSGEDLSFIDADEYPHLKMVFHTSDDIDLTTAQLDKWMVIYEPVAEGLVFYRGPADQQVVSEGQVFSGDFGFVNISDKTFQDSLSVRFDLLNYLHPGGSASTLRIHPPLPGDTTLFTLPFTTISKEGLNDVEVFVNPRIFQEKSYDNNVMVLKEHLLVQVDDMKPVIDVTFDGRHLENNEFVTSSPEINITVWDENPYMLKQDTLGINIFLAFPCDSEECDFQRIHFSRPDVSWHAADADAEFTVLFAPSGLAEGSYTLRVEAGDAKGNTGGEEPYEIMFRVAHTSSVVAPPPYPNPFDGEITFDVVVTGEESGSCFYDLEITALSGKAVVSFADHDTGLYVGRNALRWNGTDGQGNILPGGIYLYRLIIARGGQTETYRGKIVLMR